MGTTHRKTYYDVASEDDVIVRPIDAAYAGRLTRLSVEQIDGALDGFTAEIYDTYAAAVKAADGVGVNVTAPAGLIAQYTPVPAAAPSATVHLVDNPLVVANGQSHGELYNGTGNSFATSDNVNQANRTTKLFLVLKPNVDNADKVFAVTVVIEGDE